MSEEIKRWKGALEIISRKKDPNESCRAKTKSTERERKRGEAIKQMIWKTNCITTSIFLLKNSPHSLSHSLESRHDKLFPFSNFRSLPTFSTNRRLLNN